MIRRLLLITLVSIVGPALADGEMAPPAPRFETPERADAQSAGCRSCHTASDARTMHATPGVTLGCADCHGGDPQVVRPAATSSSADPDYRAAMTLAHIRPRFPADWPGSAKPKESYTLLNREDPAYIRFVNPSDYRVADLACGACHADLIRAAERSLMSTSAMFLEGASYNNGVLPFKRGILGEAYTRTGEAAQLDSPVVPDAQMLAHGILPSTLPVPRWEVVPPGDIFRVFERGGRLINSQFAELGNPETTGELQRLDEPGRPDIRQSNRGPGTGLRIAVPVLNLHKTRLNDPYLWFLGTEDQPGDYRSSGCAGCHVVYANDRDPAHSGPYAGFGHDGTSAEADPTIPRGEPGHPLAHRFTRAISTSQCMVCHMHQPNIFLNSFMGYTMWDYEADAPSMWPAQQRYPDAEQTRAVLDRNPEGAAARGNWADPAFLGRVADLNPTLKDTQFADYHGHGWNFRAVFKHDRKGNLLDKEGHVVAFDDPQKFQKTVHLASIHMDKGMHCVDCHFSQDAHGNGYLYGEVSAAIEIQCVDCHGTVDRYPTLKTSGPAAPPGGHDLTTLRNEDGSLRFEWRDGKLFQRSAVTPGLEWQVDLVKDSVDPANPHYNAKAARAKLMALGGSMRWGPGILAVDRAHKDSEMMCITCHTSWTTSCAGCHLPIEANWKSAINHFEGGERRNYATYNPQVARDDMFFLGRNSSAKGRIIAPVRSSSALVLSSTNINRDRIYVQQAPIAASGFSSQAFAPHYPHTERTVETKTCSDCHLADAGDNNAIMAQLLLQGTNFVNFVGFNAWLGERSGVEAVQVTEWEEPQAVIGSYLHRYAYPDFYRAHLARSRELTQAQHHDGDVTRCLQLRGEYLYSAAGADGLRVFDVASIGNKDVSERIVTSPVSPLGQDTHVSSRNATCVALPTDQPIAPGRNTPEIRADDQEQPFHPIYHYAFVTDAEEGLIAVDIDTLTDGEPRNNYLTRALTWNENGVLDGARHLTISGSIFYVSTPSAVIVLDMNDPLKPQLLARLPFEDVRATALQFRYLFVLDRTGLHVVDATHPDQPRPVPGASVPLADARRVYVARTFAYVADGADGVAIIDVERPEAPRLYQMFNAGGTIADASDIVVGATNASLFAYVADGAAGLKVIQLFSPENQPGFYGFSPDPKPELIAWRRTASPALALSKGLDRDRAVDETGNQIAVFGRLGSRPFTLPEMEKLYLDPAGRPWTVTDRVQPDRFVPAAPVSPPAVRTPVGPVVRRPGTRADTLPAR
jgi:hypothetical protein